MPSQELRDKETGELGRFHTIRGEQRFIPNDPAFAPRADQLPLVPEFLQAGAVGFGETLLNTGVRFNAAIDTLSGLNDTPAQLEIREVESLLSPLREQHGIATALGQSIPGVLLPASKAVQTVAGIAEGVLADPDNPLLGGVIGGAGAFLGGVAGQKLGSAIAARGKGAVARLARQDIPTTQFQRSGQAADKSIEAGLQSIPVISAWASAPIRAQQRALNRGAASVFGYEGALTPKGLGDIKFGMQKSFREIEVGIPDQVIDPALLTRIDDLGGMDTATREFIEAAGIADGEALMAIRSTLNEDMADAFINANRKEGRVIQSVLAEVDELIETGLGRELTQQWATTRKQWQFFTALRKGKAISGDGTVNLASMNNALNSIYPNFRVGADLPGAARGFGELVQALDELPKALQSSGTAERAAAGAILSGATDIAFSPVSILPAARAAGQPGISAGALAGRTAARLVEGPIDEVLQAIIDDRERSGDVE